ncbi:MAG: HNH endonuclease [Patescibacteria group bacterium]
MPEQYKRNPNTKCNICSKKIYRRPIEIKRGKVFCSVACAGIRCRKEIPCLVCGKLILAGLNKKTCSRSCSNKYRTGIKYKIGRPRDKARTFRVIKLRLLEERGNTCARCTYNKYEILQVHHKDRNRNNNKLDNLELICPNCHYEEHFLEKSWMRKSIEKNEK